jgi:molybdenum cofactor guanylyltransferase
MISAFVLAGGQSTRMGTDKAFLEWHGTTLLGHALARLSEIDAEVRIVGSVEKFAELGNVVEDQFPNHGPLGGIHAALRASSADLNLMLAIDMPYVETEFLRYLVESARESNALVTLPRAGGTWQPLCAVYRSAFADMAEEALERSENKIDRLFPKIALRIVEEPEILKSGFSSDMFRNLNTPEELHNARA